MKLKRQTFLISGLPSLSCGPMTSPTRYIHLFPPINDVSAESSLDNSHVTSAEGSNKLADP